MNSAMLWHFCALLECDDECWETFKLNHVTYCIPIQGDNRLSRKSAVRKFAIKGSSTTTDHYDHIFNQIWFKQKCAIALVGGTVVAVFDYPRPPLRILFAYAHCISITSPFVRASVKLLSPSYLGDYYYAGIQNLNIDMDFNVTSKTAFAADTMFILRPSNNLVLETNDSRYFGLNCLPN